jgi:hypothetical protein
MVEVVVGKVNAGFEAASVEAPGVSTALFRKEKAGVAAGFDSSAMTLTVLLLGSEKGAAADGALSLFAASSEELLSLGFEAVGVKLKNGVFGGSSATGLSLVMFEGVQVVVNEGPLVARADGVEAVLLAAVGKNDEKGFAEVDAVVVLVIVDSVFCVDGNETAAPGVPNVPNVVVAELCPIEGAVDNLFAVSFAELSDSSSSSSTNPPTIFRGFACAAANGFGAVFGVGFPKVPNADVAANGFGMTGLWNAGAAFGWNELARSPWTKSDSSSRKGACETSPYAFV